MFILPYMALATMDYFNRGIPDWVLFWLGIAAIAELTFYLCCLGVLLWWRITGVGSEQDNS